MTNPEIKRFSVLCDKCHHPIDVILGPSDSCSHVEKCERIGNDPRQAVWLENSYIAGTLKRPILLVQG